MDDVFPVELPDLTLARDLLQESEGLSARGALHVAVMDRQDVRQILTFDTGFDCIGWVERISD